LPPEAMAESTADLQGMVDTIVGLDDTSIVTVINSVLQARPEAAPSVVTFAVPDLTYPPARALTERRSNGWVKAYNEEKGFGFITCPELHVAFGNDVFLHVSQVPPGLFVGMPVNFAVVLDDKGRLVAHDLQPGGKGKGKDGGKGWKGGMMKGGKGDWGKGDWGKGDWGKGKGKGKKGKSKDGESIGDEFVGTIKSFNAEKGFGFIECTDLKAVYGNDVFLMSAQMGEFAVGSMVQFSAYLNQHGKPQAKDLKDLGSVPKKARTEDATGMEAANGWEQAAW